MSVNPDLRGGRRVFVETWGCQMNVLDGRRFAGLLPKEGYAETLDEADADVISSTPARFATRPSRKSTTVSGASGR